MSNKVSEWEDWCNKHWDEGGGLTVEDVEKLLTVQRSEVLREVREMVGNMKVDVGSDDKSDPFFSEPRAYNQALDDIINKLEAK